VAKAKKAATSTEANGQAISKMDAMRQTLATLGKDAANKDIQTHLKATFGITLSPATFSNYKSVASKEGGKKKKRGRKAGKKAAEAAAPAASTASTSSHGRIGGYSIDDIRAVQELAGRLGARKLQELAEVLAK